jgi:hypothetical protein
MIFALFNLKRKSISKYSFSPLLIRELHANKITKRCFYFWIIKNKIIWLMFIKIGNNIWKLIIEDHYLV